MAQTIFIQMTASGSSHSGTTTTYAATVPAGTVSPNSGITAASLSSGLNFTFSSDSVSEITCSVENGICATTESYATWVPISPSATPSATPSESAGVPTSPSASPSATPSTSPSSAGPGASPSVTPSVTPSNSVVWYEFQASEANGDPGSVCAMPTTTTYYNLTASNATGLMKLYNSKNLADPNTDTGYIKSGSKYISIGAGTLASFQPECSSISETLQKFYISSPAGGETSVGELCDFSYNVSTPAWAYLSTPFTTTTIQAGNKTIYSSTGSIGNTDPSNFTKLATTIVGSGTLTRYWAISTTSGGTTDDGTNWPTIQVTNTDVNSYASSGATLDCSDPGGEGPIP